MSARETSVRGDRARDAGAMPAEQLLEQIARYAADKKAIDLVELDLRGVLGYTDYFVICSGNTPRQAKAIHDGILEGLKHEHERLPRRVEGSADTGWVLMDYLDVVVHIFIPKTREFYRLERLWGEAPARAADAGPAQLGASGPSPAVGDEPSQHPNSG